MACFKVNGQEYKVERNIKLLRFLRDELRLTSVKDGCSEGACGTCTVLIDGKAVKCCVQQTDHMDGREILTVEGLSEYEKAVYTYAFGEAGAVQCGFCIPGMVLCAKALLAVNPKPSNAEIRRAIKGNICRCTGYMKIVEAIRIAAAVLQADSVPTKEENWRIGSRVHRLDVAEKVRGYGLYPDDLYIEDMAHASALRTAYPRAKILGIDAAKALELPGVIAVYTAADIPCLIKVGHLQRDWDTLIPVGECTRYLGDALALVVAETPEIVEAAKKYIVVDYEVYAPIKSPYEAMKPSAPRIHATGNLMAHKHVSRGDARNAISHSAHVVRGWFRTPFTEHAFLEPECAVAMPYEDGVLIYSADQSVYDTQHEIAPMLGLPLEKVRVENMLVGGGFGGKEDVSTQHHAALAAYLCRRPVKVKLSRQESILIHPKRHPMDMDFTLGCDENGIIQGVFAAVIADTGAYASLGGPVLERACTHAAGPYNYQNFEIDGKAYYTNNPPAGAFRGFGVTQTCFAMESLLNIMADKLGISGWEIRYRNAIRPDQVLPNGQIAGDATGLVECLEAVKAVYESHPYTGIACAMKNAGVGVGIPDKGRVKLLVKDKKVHILAGASCIGQGLGTVLIQFVVESTGLAREDIVYHRPNTFEAPDSGTTSGSRQTLITGEAARRAGLLLKEALATNTLAELEGRTFFAEYYEPTDPLGSDKANPKSHIAYGYAAQVAVLDEDGMLTRIVAAHDVGRAVNPLSLEGQIEGGVVMSAGFALTERYPLEDCKPLAKYGTLGLLRATNAPEVEALIIEKPGLHAAYGAIGVGEITSIPTAPAIAEAYHKYDGKWRFELPLEGTPYDKRG